MVVLVKFSCINIIRIIFVWNVSNCLMKILNLYAGIGGNRKLWRDVDVTAVENDLQIANVYMDFFPDDTMVVGDAHQYLIDNFYKFDFIWSSPPCQTHSSFRKNICVKYKSEHGIPIKTEITKALVPRIIKFRSNKKINDTCIKSALLYIHDFLHGKPPSTGATCCFNGKGDFSSL